MKLTLAKDMAAARLAAIALVNGRAGALRGRFITSIPGQDMVYLEKAAEARRYLDLYSGTQAPETLDPSPVTGFPFMVAEIGITAPDFEGLARIWVEGAASFRQMGSAIETIRLGHIALIEKAASPAAIAAITADFAGAIASVEALFGEGAPDA